MQISDTTFNTDLNQSDILVTFIFEGIVLKTDVSIHK